MTENAAMTHKTYLGDGAFVELGSFRGEIILTTEDGIRTTNRVVLGPTETAALLLWLKERNDEVPDER